VFVLLGAGKISRYYLPIVDFQEFQRQFGNNDVCRDHLFKTRWPKGLTCPKCGGKHFYTITTRNIYECKCKYQVSLTSGTIMHGSRIPLNKWFWAIYLMVHGEGVSVRQLKKDLNISNQTAWSMLDNIYIELHPEQYPKRRPKRYLKPFPDLFPELQQELYQKLYPNKDNFIKRLFK